MSLHHSRQLFQVLDIPFLDTAELIPSPNTTTPLAFQKVEVMKVIFKAVDDFNEFFPCYINNTVIVIATAKYVEDDVAYIPTLTPICDFQVIAVFLTPLVIIKAEYTIG
jgi:hypothetical protein